MNTVIFEDETLDLLCNERLKIIQKKDGYRFSIDAILLANFIKLKKNERALDIGTGCGIIPIYMTLKGYKNNITGIEIQDELFGLAVRNREINNCKNLEFIKGDLESKIKELKAKPFDVVMSNPPYTKQDTGRRCPTDSRLVARYESALSLQSLLSAASSVLNRKGRLYLIYPVRRLGEVVYSAKSKRFEPKRLRFVHPKRDNKANLFLIEFIKEGGIEVTVEKPLYIYENIYYTDEIKNYYQ